MTAVCAAPPDDPCTAFWSHVAALAEPGMTFDRSIAHMAEALEIARAYVPLPLPFEPEAVFDAVESRLNEITTE